MRTEHFRPAITASAANRVKGYLLIPLIALTGCGSEDATRSLSTATTETPIGVSLSASITAGQVSTNGTYVLPRSGTVTVPARLTGISGLNETSRAVVYFGADTPCSYQRQAYAIHYLFMNGQCVGGYSSGDPIALSAGDTITVTLPSGYTTQHTAVEAELTLN